MIDLYRLRAYSPWPHDPVLETGVVLDIGRDRELSTGLRAVDHQRLELCARRIDRGGEACRTRTEDDDFFMMFIDCHICVVKQ